MLRYAKSQIPASKIILGVPLYGYDWVGNHGTPLSWLQVFRLANEHADPAALQRCERVAVVHLHRRSRPPATWSGSRTRRARRRSSRRREGAGIGGVYLWVYGYEDTSIWKALRRTLPHRLPAASIWQPGI